MTKFDELGLAEPLLRALNGEGYTSPTPIQQKVIPVMLDDRDVLGTAQTGTGKTAAFVLPLLQRLITHPVPRTPRHCGALILAPTRELAAQIRDSIRVYGRHIRPSVALVVGGVKPFPQIKALKPGVDIVVATPGRLLDHMNTGAIKLDMVETVILDEADHMLDLGFIPAIRRIMQAVPKERQTALLSATMPTPIRALAKDFLDRPVEIAVAPVAQPIELISQRVMMIPAGDKKRVLVDVLKSEQAERTIVFSRTKHGADKITKHLEREGINAVAIHGNKNQSQRDRALGQFKDGRVSVMVATDVAARGIDIDGVTHVINFELPNVPESYVHRIGRTARAGKSGVAIAFCDSEERGLLRDIERLIAMDLKKTDEDGEPVILPAHAPQKKGGGGRGRKPGGNSNSTRPWKRNAEGGRNERGRNGAPAGNRDGGRPAAKPDSRKPRRQPQRAAS
ncbi:MAG: DEAD/DEAH box helicase [Minwuia sp.]|nr:DEAD/DEAH box helicase [Minwuia sp.]